MKKRRLFTNIAVLLLTAIMTLSVLGGCAQAGNGTGLLSTETTVKETVTQQETTAAQKETAPQQNEKKTGKKEQETTSVEEAESTITEDGEYYTKDDVAEYLYLYEHLPDNYITKNEAKKLGWNSSKGNLWDVAPGKVIGGDTFGNREGLLPEEKNRKYYECDVNYEGGFRGSDRIIYSNDGLIYFTEDHYNSFELLYGEEE